MSSGHDMALSKSNLRFFLRSAVRSRAHGYIYKPVPKAANTYFKHLIWAEHHRRGFRNPPPDGLLAVHQAQWRIGEAENPAPWDNYGRNDAAALFADFVFEDRYLRFTCVRNPYARMLSAYLEKFGTQDLSDDHIRHLLGLPRKPADFAEFVAMVGDLPNSGRNIHWTSQVFCTAYDFFKYDRLFQFEDIADVEAFITSSLLKGAAGNPAATEASKAAGAAHRTNAGDKLLRYYDDRTVDAVRSIYDEDFRAFGYADDPTRLAPERPPIPPAARIAESRALDLTGLFDRKVGPATAGQIGS